MRGRIVLTAVFSLFFLFASGATLQGFEYRDRATGYSFDLPDGWKLLSEDGNGGSSFADADSNAILQAFVMPGGTHSTAFELYLDMRKRLDAAGDGESFDFSGRDAVFAALNFSPAKISARGYFIFIRGETDYALFAYAPETVFGTKEDSLLSALDSFSPDEIGRSLPGPVSQYLSPLLPSSPETRTVNILGKNVSVTVDPRAYENSQALIEREAGILLQAGGEGRTVAWQRYYRLIFRDSFFRLSEFGASLASIVEEKGISDENVPQELLSWIQNFSYERTGTVSDLLSPVEAAGTLTGDCDSRALLFVILLRYLSYDSTMFVSMKYAHSLGGVAVPGNGARLEADGRSYLVAETTAHVRLGLIDAGMADPSGWIPIPLPVISGM